MPADRPFQNLVILNGTEGGVKDLLYLPFHIGALIVFTIGIASDMLSTQLFR